MDVEVDVAGGGVGVDVEVAGDPVGFAASVPDGDPAEDDPEDDTGYR